MQGTKLGPYEILDRLGAGGMGEVWAAQDTRLGRKVAIKVLPAEYAADRDRLARFEQEARAAAALNHPHIAAVYDVGHELGADGARTHFLVQELLEGRSLREELGAGALPRGRALQLAAEIAEALAAAHRAGIVHRDLKPENVFVSPDGHAKVLDFGLAKLTEAAAPALGSQTMSPTVLGTATGTIMGTAGYMSPEQVMGQEVDGRTDLFALGCVLYEMLTGDRAFGGDTVIDTLHAITRTQPRHLRQHGDVLDADSRWLLDKSLEKDRLARYQHADDLAVDLRRLASRPPAAAVDGGVTGPEAEPVAARGRAGWIAAALATAVALVAGIAALNRAAERQVVRLSIPARFGVDTSHYYAVSADGRRLAYIDRVTGDLTMRLLDSFGEIRVPGGEGAIGPFFSPDGRRLAFFQGGKLWAVDVAGGNPREICDVASTNSSGVWHGDDIYFVQYATGTGVWRTPASGGVAEQILPAGEQTDTVHGPRMLPDGSGVIVEVTGMQSTSTASRIHFFDGRDSVLVDRPQVRYMGDGRALWVDGGTLFTAGYDEATFVITGEPVPLVDAVVDFELSAAGTLVYRSGSGAVEVDLVRLPRGGGEPIGRFSAAAAERPQVSPDGSQFAVNDAADILIWDATRGTRQIVGQGIYPVWWADGASIVAQARAEDGSYLLVRSLLDGTAGKEILHSQQVSTWPTDISPDGRLLLYYELHPVSERDIWVLPLEGGEPFPFLATPASERSAVFSPGGRWVAYMSDVTGREEVYVRPAPGLPGGETLVTPAGGREPRWSPGGDEIYFRKDDGLWAVPVSAAPAFRVGAAELLLRGNFRVEEGGRNQQYDVFPNGDLLVILVPENRDELRVVVNWSEELKRASR